MTQFSSPGRIQRLKLRAEAFDKIRQFFRHRDVMEVDPPTLSRAATPDIHLASLSTELRLPGNREAKRYYLHTSPEYAMKRLLCEGSGDIYFLGKVFRDGDLSPRHQPEFTLLEWYRLSFSLEQMMTETAALLQAFIGALPVRLLSYQQAFAEYAGIDDIHQASAESCRVCLAKHQVPEVIGVAPEDKPLWEQLILTEVIETQLGRGEITCLYHYPAREAALAQISSGNPQVAERFEVFIEGVELANGYLELQDSRTYRARFEEQLRLRQANHKPSVPMDEALLTALSEQGLPDCSGVALGVDRLLALVSQCENLADVLSLDIENA